MAKLRKLLGFYILNSQIVAQFKRKKRLKKSFSSQDLMKALFKERL